MSSAGEHIIRQYDECVKQAKELGLGLQASVVRDAWIIRLPGGAERSMATLAEVRGYLAGFAESRTINEQGRRS